MAETLSSAPHITKPKRSGLHDTPLDKKLISMAPTGGAPDATRRYSTQPRHTQPYTTLSALNRKKNV